jgi:hypothetical protein
MQPLWSKGAADFLPGIHDGAPGKDNGSSDSSGKAGKDLLHCLEAGEGDVAAAAASRQVVAAATSGSSSNSNRGSSESWEQDWEDADDLQEADHDELLSGNAKGGGDGSSDESDDDDQLAADEEEAGGEGIEEDKEEMQSDERGFLPSLLRQLLPDQDQQASLA